MMRGGSFPIDAPIMFFRRCKSICELHGRAGARVHFGLALFSR